MKVAKNFLLAEFGCRDGTPVPEHLIPNVIALAKNLQVLRDYIKEALTLNSAYRTKVYNRKVGGAVNSMHLQAKASDLVCRSLTPRQLKAVIEKLIKEGKMQNGGIGIYPSFVHYDIGIPRRWDETKK